MTVYIIDTNVISDIAAPTPNQIVLEHFVQHRYDILCLCEAVDYEIERGYLKTGATTRLRAYENKVRQQFQWGTITEDDWKQAAQFWADMANKGRAFSDVDLLIAAVAKRFGGVIVSADDDFDALSIQRENWRVSQ